MRCDDLDDPESEVGHIYPRIGPDKPSVLQLPGARFGFGKETMRAFLSTR